MSDLGDRSGPEDIAGARRGWKNDTEVCPQLSLVDLTCLCSMESERGTVRAHLNAAADSSVAAAYFLVFLSAANFPKQSAFSLLRVAPAETTYLQSEGPMTGFVGVMLTAGLIVLWECLCFRRHTVAFRYLRQVRKAGGLDRGGWQGRR
jgi:hypothetical protein